MAAAGDAAAMNDPLASNAAQTLPILFLNCMIHLPIDGEFVIDP
jgi:hypothetical protein